MAYQNPKITVTHVAKRKNHKPSLGPSHHHVFSSGSPMKHLEAWRSPRRQSLQLARFRHGTWTSQHRDFTFLAEATIFRLENWWIYPWFIHKNQGGNCGFRNLWIIYGNLVLDDTFVRFFVGVTCIHCKKKSSDPLMLIFPVKMWSLRCCYGHPKTPQDTPDVKSQGFSPKLGKCFM